MSRTAELFRQAEHTLSSGVDLYDISIAVHHDGAIGHHLYKLLSRNGQQLEEALPEDSPGEETAR